MDVTFHHPDDAQTLDKMVRRETDAKQRDRYRVVQLAIAGEQTQTIMHMPGRSRGFVQAWAYAYRDGGLDAIAVKPQPGRPPALPVCRVVARPPIRNAVGARVREPHCFSLPLIRMT